MLRCNPPSPDFDDWIDLFRVWQKDIGVDRLAEDGHVEAIYGDLPSPTVEFGEFAGQKKWERVLQIPNQEMRDALQCIFQDQDWITAVKNGGMKDH